MKELISPMSAKLPLRKRSFSQLLEEFKTSMELAFHADDEIDHFSSTRGMPPSVLKRLMAAKPLSLCIPEQYGGWGGGIKENLAFLSAAAYESLSYALTLGINNVLFIQPVVKYGQESVKQKIFSRFLDENSMGGLMITEPDFGSDALNMQTSYTEKNGLFHLKGTKHWAGLTGAADFWILTARKSGDGGNLMRDIEMFICDVNSPGQNIVVEEYYENMGLYQIPYGRNKIDVNIPGVQKLIPQTTGIQMLLDMLHRSRYQFPGMGLGFVKRILDEAINHTRSRHIGNKSLFSHDQVQHRLAKLQSAFTICSAFCLHSDKVATTENNLSGNGPGANIIKSVTTDIMQESAQSLLQLFGAKGYKLTNIAGRSVADSRPFQIFEGSNDILYHQIADSILKLMKTTKEQNFYQFLKGYASRAAERIREMVNFDPGTILQQRKLVEFGQVISRIVSMDHVLHLGENGFRKDLIENSILVLKQEISSLMNTFRQPASTRVITDYEEGSYWLDFAG